MRRFVSILISVVAIAVVFQPQPVSAELGSVLGEIEWGDNPEQVVEKLRSQKLAELREDSRLRNDRPAMQRARTGVLDNMRRIEDSYTELRGAETDYDMSIITNEFTKNNGESLLRVRDDMAQRFYFFLDGSFYKLVIAYVQDHVEHMDFEAFMSRVRQQYGEPSATEYGTVRGEESIVEALWRDGPYKLRINDRRSFFGTFTMTFSDRETVERLVAADRTFGGRGEEEEQTRVSDRVRSLTEPSTRPRRRSTAADELSGDIEVNLPVRQIAEEEDEEEASSSPTPTPSASSRPSSDDTPTPTPQRDTSTDDDDDDDDLVIY